MSQPDAAARQNRTPLLLKRAHRPFFLVTALYAAFALGLWLASWRGLGGYGSLWHGHEMIFGFAGAAFAGFLLTAVPNWTKRPPTEGGLLALLLALWLAGRVVMGFGVVEWIDLLFLPALGIKVLVDIVAAKNYRNLIVPLLISILICLNIVFHYGDRSLALHVAVYVVIAMVTLIAGRIAPLFTMMKLGIKDEAPATAKLRARLTTISVPVVLLVAGAELVMPGSTIAGWCALLAAIVLSSLMLTWHGHRSLRQPMIWIMHAGFIWVPIGFFLTALYDIGGVGGGSTSLHALTAGAVGVMVMAVSSRAAFGHSGRGFDAPPFLVVAYLLVIAAAFTRVFVPSAAAIDISATLWVLGYGLYAVVLWPILTRPRADGQPG